MIAAAACAAQGTLRGLRVPRSRWGSPLAGMREEFREGARGPPRTRRGSSIGFETRSGFGSGLETVAETDARFASGPAGDPVPIPLRVHAEFRSQLRSEIGFDSRSGSGSGFHAQLGSRFDVRRNGALDPALFLRPCSLRPAEPRGAQTREFGFTTCGLHALGFTLAHLAARCRRLRISRRCRRLAARLPITTSRCACSLCSCVHDHDDHCAMHDRAHQLPQARKPKPFAQWCLEQSGCADHWRRVRTLFAKAHSTNSASCCSWDL